MFLMTKSDDEKVYKIQFSKQADNYFSRLDRKTKIRIDTNLQWLAQDPNDCTLDIKPLVGRQGIFRLRVGNYRIIFSIEEEIKVIAVSTILPRGQIYKYI